MARNGLSVIKAAGALTPALKLNSAHMRIPTKIRSSFLCIAIAFGAIALPQQSLSADDYGDPYYEYRDEVDRGEFSYDDSQDIPWIENETEILAIPARENLAEVRLDRAPEGLTMLIDKSRIAVNPDDRVIRVWLWVRRDGGSESGTFEGFRCATREYKVYAYANPSRQPPVKKAKNPRWKGAGNRGSADFRRELLDDYFCGIRGTRAANEIVDQITNGFTREYFMSQ